MRDKINMFYSRNISGRKTEMNKKIFVLLLITTLTLSAFLCGCGRKRENTNHDEITPDLGESIQLTLGNIPQGKTAEDYRWHCGLELSVDGSGQVQANEMGESYVSATLKYKGTEYFEYFKIIVPVEMDTLSLDKGKVLMLVGQSDVLTAFPSVELPSNQKIEWSSSDNTIIKLEHLENFISNSDDSIYRLMAVGEGSATITASCGGVQASCEVKASDPKTPDEIMAYLDDWQSLQYIDADGTACVELKSAGISLPADGVQSLLGSAPDGKYLVVWEYQETQSVGKPTPNYDNTALLPPAYRPHSLGEVEYILRVTEGDSKQVAVYGQGVKGMLRSAVIILENAQTGEVLETLYSNQGAALPQTITVSKEFVPEFYYGDAVPSSIMMNALIRSIGTLWLEEHRAVLFHESGTARYCYGSRVTLPDTIGSINLVMDNAPAALIIPSGVNEILNTSLEFAEIESITVYEDSFARRWVDEREHGNVTVLPTLSDK